MSSGKPPGAPAGPARSDLGLRAASGAVLASVALATAYWGGPVFIVLWTAASVGIAVEWLTLTAAAPRRVLLPCITVALAAAGLSLGFGQHGWIAAACIGAAVVAAAVVAAGPRDRAWAIGGILYAALIAVVPVAARQLPDIGLAVVFWMFAVVWTTDIAAYFTGRSLGGPKLMPSVSPKKTWSGFAGGTLAGSLAGLAVAVVARRNGVSLPLGDAAVLGLSVLASIAGQAGDLAESALKRHAGVKDSSHLIPGHGGLMDRLDAFWAVSAIVGALLVLRCLS